MSPAIFLLAVASISLNALAQVALRKTMLIAGVPTPSTAYLNYGISLAMNPWFLSGMLCYAVSIGLWLLVLAKVEVSLAYPLASIGYLIAATIGYFYLGENVTMVRLFGILLICTGIVFIIRSA
jgi:multidrug transporter EmrE-like cation transporter